LDNFKIYELDKEAVEIFAKGKARLKKSGLLIADMDLMIASITIANDLSLVTNNHKHFERIKGLRLIRWVE
jgi:predicted nucleic acid-binding protein